jgi:hypothetical protein
MPAVVDTLCKIDGDLIFSCNNTRDDLRVLCGGLFELSRFFCLAEPSSNALTTYEELVYRHFSYMISKRKG